MYIFGYLNGLLIVPSCLESKRKLQGEKWMRLQEQSCESNKTGKQIFI